ncbi:M3 family oligoendopeptidase [Candidatus Woesearchaeota archaeon]|nr:M3 family oligoendopeptidase [Candidatus Woesearchaeota archaeon]
MGSNPSLGVMAYSTEWDLSPLLDGKTVDDNLTELNSLVKSFGTHREKLEGISPKNFKNIVEEYTLITDKMVKVSAYAELLLTTKTDDPERMALSGCLDQFCSEAGNKMRFFSLWWKGLNDVEKYLEVLGSDRYNFEHKRAFAEFTLPEKEENIISIKDSTGVSGLKNVYSILGSNMEYELDGETLTYDQLSKKFKHEDSAVRKRAYQVLFKTIAPFRAAYGEIYSNLVRDMASEAKLRGYKSVLSIRNLQNDLPDKAVEAHLQACRESAPLWQRFLKLKGKALGIEMTRFDIYASLSEGSEEYTYDAAVELTLSALGDFSPNLRKAAEEIYEKKQVHVYPKKGKRGGAFCFGVTPGLPPYLMYNYANTLNDVATVAHETGHGVHSQLGRKHSSLSWGHAIPVAETASTFAEMLLSDHLQRKNPSMRRELLVHQLNDFYATVSRQSFFTLWEIEAHKLLAEGKSIDDVSNAYKELLVEQFGDIAFDDIFKDEWLVVHHFFNWPFYCYGYSFGNLLTLAMFSMYKEEGESFVAKYEEFLSAAQTMSPVDLCAIVGADITKKEFWLKGLKVIEGMIDELESIL